MADTRPTILIVDDKPENLYAMKVILRNLDAELDCVSSGEEALTLSLEKEFCLAIVDVQMPEMDGYELVELLRSNASTRAMPVIFVSAIYSDEYSYRKGYDAGAVDFLSKPVNSDILLSKVKVFIELWQQKLELQNLINRLQDWNNYLDNTVRERTETLKAANNALADEMRFQTELFRAAAGELDTSLANLHQSAAKLRGQAKTQSGEQVQKILFSEKNMRETITGMKDSTRITEGLTNLSRKAALLDEIVSAACDDCRARLDENNVTIQVDNVNGLPSLQVDADLARLLLRQVILHALHYLQEGEGVTLSGGLVPTGYIPAVQQEAIHLTVAFQGPGINRDYAQWVSSILKEPQAFPDPAEENYFHPGGSSLGLRMAQRIAEAHGGLVWAEANPPEMVFHVLLPLA